MCLPGQNVTFEIFENKNTFFLSLFQQNDKSTEDLHIVGAEDLSFLAGKVSKHPFTRCRMSSIKHHFNKLLRQKRMLMIGSLKGASFPLICSLFFSLLRKWICVSSRKIREDSLSQTQSETDIKCLKYVFSTLSQWEKICEMCSCGWDKAESCYPSLFIYGYGSIS